MGHGTTHDAREKKEEVGRLNYSQEGSGIKDEKIKFYFVF